MESRAWSCTLAVSFVLLVLLNASPAAAGGEGEKVLTLDRSNFTETVSKHDFIVVAFYAPWCFSSKALAPQYEKAASTLSKHEPPIILAKVDATDETNRELATEFEIYGFPTIKILRNGGKHIRQYYGPREADFFVDYLKKQVGPASAEIKSLEDATGLIDEKKIFVVGVFPKFSGEEYENFMTLAEKLRYNWGIYFTTDYNIAHTLDAKFLPRGEPVDKPTLRLLKPFDELFVDFQDFKVDAMEKFIEGASIQLVTVSSNAKAVLFVNFRKEHDSFETKYKDVATLYKEKGVSFQFGDVDGAQGAFQYFGLKEEQAPLLIIQDAEGQKYLKANIEPSEIASWVKDYLDGHVKPFIRSEPIPDVNNEPVKVVVTNSLQDMVFSSGKNVLLEFYAPWCGHCKKLATILEEVAISFENDPDVVIAKLDATVNDIPSDTFDVQGYPTLYFRSSSGNLLPYDGEKRTKEDIVDFIQKNRDSLADPISTKSEAVDTDSVKDKL